MRRGRKTSISWYVGILAVILFFGIKGFSENPRTELPEITESNSLVSEISTESIEHNESATTTTTEEPILYGAYKVVRVVDGDTFVVDIDGTETKIRLIGIDTPESVHVDESRNTEEGLVASDFTKALLKDESVYLEYDVSTTDKYGRTLAYAYLSDGETMINALLLSEGMAQVFTVQPNCKYADVFLELENNARNNGVGFWGE